MGKKSIMFLVLICSLLILGCVEEDVVRSRGFIEGYIKDIFTDAPLISSQVGLSDLETLTDNKGQFTLYRSEEGNHYFNPNPSGNTYSVFKENYYNKIGSSLMSYGQKNLTSYLTPKADNDNNYFVSGVVISSEGEKLEGVNVVINGTFAQRTYKVETDNQGNFTFSNIPSSRINLYAYKDGYDSGSINIIKLSKNELNQQIKLNENKDQKYGYIEGNIFGFAGIDDVDTYGENCAYSIIFWNRSGGNASQFNMADEAGNYRLWGIPEGTTQINVRAPGFYYPASGTDNTIEVGADETTIHNVKMKYIRGEEDF